VAEILNLLLANLQELTFSLALLLILALWTKALKRILPHPKERLSLKSPYAIHCLGAKKLFGLT
jgi:hypothetical protein|tara:strand:- start:794 stop:985 length:192 start_codon:yes stop_codon:yes gene_type:complete